jgi:3-dehydrosphinganine reductase
VAFITGGSSGIGLEIAKQLAEAGAQVWILARRRELLDQASEQVRCLTDRSCGALTADVSDWEQVQAAVEQVTRQAGTPDLVVNSAGITFPGLFQDLDLEIFHRLMDVNYFGTVHVCKAVLPGMLKRGSGHIINISSLSGHIPTYGYTAYTASKYAVTAFTEALRMELKPSGIRLSIVFPADTDTPQLAYENQFKPPEMKALDSLGGMQTPDHVARVVLGEAAKGRFIIIPGREGKLFYKAYNLAGNLRYPVLDYLLAQAKRKVQKSNHS